MKVEIVYPFVDFRRFDSNKNDLLVQRPKWPKPLKKGPDYYRSMGQIYPPYYNSQSDSNKNYTSSCIANGVRLKDANIIGLKGINRVVDFKHDNDIFGFYSISFFIKVGTFNTKTVDDIYDYFRKVEFNIVDLVDHTQGLVMDNLKGYLCRQYYWATRLLARKNDKSKKYYQRDKNTIVNGVEKIVMKNQKQEMRDIIFLEPYFFLEYTFDDGIKDDFKNGFFSLFKKNVLSFKKKKNMRIVTVKRKFYDKNEPDLKTFSDYMNTIKYNFLLFDYLGKLSDYTRKETDNRLIHYVNNLEKTYNKSFEDDKFDKIKKYYEQHYPDYIETMNTNLLSRIGDNKLSDLIFAISNNQLILN